MENVKFAFSKGFVSKEPSFTCWWLFHIFFASLTASWLSSSELLGQAYFSFLWGKVIFLTSMKAHVHPLGQGC